MFKTFFKVFFIPYLYFRRHPFTPEQELVAPTFDLPYFAADLYDPNRASAGDQKLQDISYTYTMYIPSKISMMSFMQMHDDTFTKVGNPCLQPINFCS